MMCEYPILLLVVYFSCGLGIPTSEQIEFPPKAYHYQAEIIDLIEKRVTPVEYWRNDNHKQRVDHFYGVERKFVDGGNGRRGIIVHYKADENGDTKLVCSEKGMMSFMSMSQRRLPDLSDFELAGEKLLRGHQIQIYTDKGGFHETTLYMNGSVPIKLEEKASSAIKGDEREHTITNYLMYETEFNEEDLNSRQFCDDEKSTEGIKDIPDDNLINHIDTGYTSYNKKTYTEEREMRKKILRDNLRLVKEHNSQNLSYKLTLNQFADRTPEEMMLFTGDVSNNHDLELSTHPFPHTETEIEEMMDDIPEEWDWRIEGKVSKVKSQGSCGSCWAFAATAAIESALSIKYGRTFDLSEQSLVDCDWPYDSNGCQGGYAANAFKFGIKHGVPTEMDYGEYMATNGRCHINETTRTYKLQGFVTVTPLSVNALKVAVYKHGPVSVSIFSTGKFYLYSSGIYYDIPEPEFRTKTNHAVVVVGYGVRDGVPYWIVKNSWGQRWGEDGYGLIAASDNAANLLLKPYYPLV